MACHHPAAIVDYPHYAAGVALEDRCFHSRALNRDMCYRVYLPQKLSPGRRLPVVYLLHGRAGSFRNWSNYSDVAQYAVHIPSRDQAPLRVSAAPQGPPTDTGPGDKSGLILVMPQGDSSYYINAAEKPGDRYQDYLVNDLIADVEAHLPAAPGRQNRAIVGVSMGGFAAVQLALSRPDLFVFAGAISPPVDVAERKFNLSHIEESMRFRSLFGPEGSATRRQSDPFVLAENTERANTPYLYLTAGDQEYLLGPIRRFASKLGERQFRFEFHTKPGGHDWTEWNKQIPGCFASLQRELDRAQGQGLIDTQSPLKQNISRQ